MNEVTNEEELKIEMIQALIAVHVLLKVEHPDAVWHIDQIENILAKVGVKDV